jgi:hypothetical protein
LSRYARFRQGPLLAVLTMLAAERAAARGSARLRASLDESCARRFLAVPAGTEKRRAAELRNVISNEYTNCRI